MCAVKFPPEKWYIALVGVFLLEMETQTLLLKSRVDGEFLGGPVVRTLRSYC